MEWNTISHILLSAAIVLLGGLSLWYKGHMTLRGAVAALIAQAEALYADTVKAGGLKFAWVVDSLYALLPLPLRAVVSRAMVGQLVQNTFDAVAAYAKAQLDRAAEKAETALPQEAM